MTFNLYTKSFKCFRAISPLIFQSRSLYNNPYEPGTVKTKYNTGILFVPQQEAWIVERFGKFSRTLEPGLNIAIPFIEKIAYVQLLKEFAINIPNQSAITADNVVLQMNGVLFLKVRDAFLASYGVEDPEFAITQLAQTTMRSEIGKINLDNVFKERELLNNNIVKSINKASDPWGIDCLRYEIRDIELPEKIQEAMQMQVAAERQKRALVLESEGLREAEINKAEAKKRKCVLESEGVKIENINRASGEAEALLAIANAKAKAIDVVAMSISQNYGENAVQLTVAEKYIEQFGKIAGTNNTLMMSSPINDVAAMVTQALTIYKSIDKVKHQKPNESVEKPEQCYNK